MSKLTFIRRDIMLSIAVAACLVVLNAATASAQSHLIQICHKGQTISVDVHAVPAHLDHGDTIVPCGTPPPCACGEEFDPVICNGTIYANQCLADCAGATGCTHFGVCSNIYNPVICNGVTYANACQARLAGCTVFTLKCACGLIYAPVRCDDGITYVNACVAVCNGESGCQPIQ